MPLSKARMRERKRQDRLIVKPSLSVVKPNEDIVSQVKRLYPNGQLPNCPDSRYRPDVKPKRI